jgi:hypothetical protein
VSPEHLNKVMLATFSLHNHLLDDADPVVTDVNCICSPPTHAVTHVRHIGWNSGIQPGVREDILGGT